MNRKPFYDYDYQWLSTNVKEPPNTIQMMYIAILSIINSVVSFVSL